MRDRHSSGVLLPALAVCWGLAGCTVDRSPGFALDDGGERDAARSPGGGSDPQRPAPPAIVLPPPGDAAPRVDDAGDEDDAGRASGRDANAPAECGNGVVETGEACDTGLHACCARDCSGALGGASVCRPAEGACDVVERCDGTSFDCPADATASNRTLCRTASGACDVAEMCDGTNKDCPSDAVAPSTTECRAAMGLCDVAERCDGTNKDCPSDAIAPNATECRPAVNVCDVAERCDGTSRTCPVDAFAPNTTQCSTPIGPCDVADFCTGTNTTCPDSVAAIATPCGVAAGPCDRADACDGFSPTCVDAVAPNTTQCGVAGTGLCDLDDFCDGRGKLCPDTVAAAATTCRPAANECDVAEQCDGVNPACPGDAFQPALTSCGSASDTACDNPDSCDGAGTCLPRNEPGGAPCGDQGVDCHVDDTCDGAGNCTDNGFDPPSTACGSSGSNACDSPDSCDALGNCQPRPVTPCQGIVFVTSADYFASLMGGGGGISEGDAICNMHAQDAGLPGTYRAWLSDSTVDARDRIPDWAYRLPDDTPICANRADLLDGNLLAPINVDEAKNPRAAGGVWTGTIANGTGTGGGVYCAEWTDFNDPSGAMRGNTAEFNELWTQEFVDACDAPLPLYCFQTSP